MRRLFIIIVVLLSALQLRAAVEPLLEQFGQTEEKAAMTRLANRFFEELLAQKVIDDPIRFNDTTPADTLREQVWYWAAEYFYDQQQYEQAELFGKKALPLFRKGNDRIGESDCLNILAIANLRLGDYEEAIGYILQCYRLDEQSGDTERISASLNVLTSIFIAANQPQEAVKYVQKGLEMLPKVSDERKSVLLGMASEVYHATGDDQKALAYAEQAYDIDYRLGREYKSMVRLSQKASALIGLHQFSEAEQALRLAVPYFRSIGDRQSLGISCNKMGMALVCQLREQEAVPYYREAAEAFVAIGDRANEMRSRKGLYESLWMSHPDSAKIELERFNELKDSLYNSASAESLARYNAEFGNEWLQQQNAAERNAKRNAIVLGTIIAVVLLLLSALVWWMMRRRQRRQSEINQQLSANIEELRQQYRQLSVHYDNALATGKDNALPDGLSPADRAFLEKTVESINEHILKGHVDADSVASSMNMSLFQFRQRLSVVVGETPQNFIAMIRMRRARYLLDNRPELNINEVAQLCAYNDTPNFSRAFKKTFGITPTQYLEKK